MDCSPPGSSIQEFSRQEYWSGLPCPPPGIFLIQGLSVHFLQLLNCRQVLDNPVYILYSSSTIPLNFGKKAVLFSFCYALFLLPPFFNCFLQFSHYYLVPLPQCSMFLRLEQNAGTVQQFGTHEWNLPHNTPAVKPQTNAHHWNWPHICLFSIWGCHPTSHLNNNYLLTCIFTIIVTSQFSRD